LARTLGAALGLPVFGLDKIVWQSGWEKTSKETVQAKEAELIAQPNWIIEGVSYQVLDAADIVVFLDVPRRVSYLRSIKRTCKYLLKTRPELPDNCPEILIMRRQIGIIWRFSKRVKPKILTKLSNKKMLFYIIRTDKDMDSLRVDFGL